MEDAGFTPGEEDELIFSYLSRIGATTKYMLPERKYLSLPIIDTYINIYTYHSHNLSFFLFVS